MTFRQLVFQTTASVWITFPPLEAALTLRFKFGCFILTFSYQFWNLRHGTFPHYINMGTLAIKPLKTIQLPMNKSFKEKKNLLLVISLLGNCMAFISVAQG